MKIVRLYTGNDQKSHFEEIGLKFGGDQKILTANSRPATMVVFRCVPAGNRARSAPAPRRQYLVTISGSWEIEAGHGVKRSVQTGDVSVADDADWRRPYLPRLRWRTGLLYDRAAGGLDASERIFCGAT
jgi:hypothetical protein